MQKPTPRMEEPIQNTKKLALDPKDLFLKQNNSSFK
jgi:hypothetical protein